jgi:predicted DsbA family dithiol-disulfide isomerase
MLIEIWSDVVCPWCYIGKRRLESALGKHELPADSEVEIVWRSFQLDPGSPTEVTQTVAEHLGSKYGGGPSAGQAMIDNVEAIAAEEGLVYRLGEAKRANTLDAHRLLHLAKETGHQGELKEALLSAYFTQALTISDHGVLREVAVTVGLDGASVDELLASDRFRDEVFADQEQAAAYGASAVPFFVFDRKLGVSGAQPVEVFEQALARTLAG